MVITYTLILLDWQQVSAVMAGAAGSVLTILTPTLVLLTWQCVSNFMADAARSIFNVFTSLILLTWQLVSEWFYGRCSWVCSYCSHPHSPDDLSASECFHGSLTGSVLTTTLIVLAWQFVSGFMESVVGSVLTDGHHCHLVLLVTGSEWFHGMCSWVSCIVFTFTPILLAWQEVSDFMACAAGLLLTVLFSTLILLAW